MSFRKVLKSQYIMDAYVPAGTYVSCSPLTSSHDPNIYPEPDKFHPQRWLTSSGKFDEAKIIKMQVKGESVQFGKGPHKCPG
jgi:cytochrome P450